MTFPFSGRCAHQRVAQRHRPAVRDFVLALNAPCTRKPRPDCEGRRSGAAPDHVRERMLHAADSTASFASAAFHGPFWRDLDETRSDLPVISFSAVPFAV